MRRFRCSVLALACSLLAPGWSASVAQEAEPAPEAASAPAAGAEAEPTPVAPRISVETGPEQDGAIERRLELLYGGVEALNTVRVRVRAGVVELSGEAPTAAASELAEQLARQIEHVALVENRIETVKDVRRRLDQLYQRLRRRAVELVGYLPLIGVALAVLGLTLALAQALGRWDWLYRRFSRRPFIRDLLSQVVRIAVFVTGLVLILEILDVTALLGAVLGTAGVLGLALGFALRDLVENYLASVLLSLRQPFAPNDLVRIREHEGIVVTLTSRATVLMTLEGHSVRIPNSTVFKSVILNYTRNPLRRFDFEVGIAVDEDVGEASEAGLGALRAMVGVLDEPPPFVLLSRLDESSVPLRFHGWVDQAQADFLKVRSEALRLVKAALEAAGIEMPEPIHRVRFEKAARATPARRASEQADVSPDLRLGQKVAEQRARSSDENLLDPHAPRE